MDLKQVNDLLGQEKIQYHQFCFMMTIGSLVTLLYSTDARYMQIWSFDWVTVESTTRPAKSHLFTPFIEFLGKEDFLGQYHNR